MFAHLPFDILILLGLLLPLITWWYKPCFKTLTYKLLLLCSSFIALVIFYGSFVEPHWVVINTQTFDIIPEEKITAVFLADIHLGPYKKEAYAQRIVTMVEEINPEIILMGGDYIYKTDAYAPMLTSLKPLADKYPVYAIMGNHEYDIGLERRDANTDQANSIAQTLTELGITVLRDQSETITLKNHELQIIGVDDIFYDKTDIDQAFAQNDPAIPTVVLAHNPDTALYTKNHDYDLMLSGHTHGGQIRLPMIGPIASVPTELGRAFDAGLFTINNHEVFITTGLGESGPRARLFTRPEIVILEF